MSFDLLQTVLIIAVSVATIFLTVIGLQLISLLKDLGVIVKRVEKISQGVTVLNNLVDKVFNEVENLSEGLRFVYKIINRLTKKESKDE